MNDILYIITKGEYSDYHICAVFKDKDKATAFCNCHAGCTLETHRLKDNCVYTPFDAVEICISLYKDKEKIDFRFGRYAKEDAEVEADENVTHYTDSMTEIRYYLRNENIAYVGINELSIHLYRMLPQNYDEEKIKAKYTKVYHDIKAELLYFLAETGYTPLEEYSSIDVRLLDFLNAKFGIEVPEDSSFFT